jgi:hypothetical protein
MIKKLRPRAQLTAHAADTSNALTLFKFSWEKSYFGTAVSLAIDSAIDS